MLRMMGLELSLDISRLLAVPRRERGSDEELNGDLGLGMNPLPPGTKRT